MNNNFKELSDFLERNSEIDEFTKYKLLFCLKSTFGAKFSVWGHNYSNLSSLQFEQLQICFKYLNCLKSLDFGCIFIIILGCHIGPINSEFVSKYLELLPNLKHLVLSCI